MVDSPSEGNSGCSEASSISRSGSSESVEPGDVISVRSDGGCKLRLQM